MGKIPPVVIQFLAIISCNILTFTFGLSNFWATINLLELTSENSTFPTGPLSHQEFSFIISIGNIGSLLGNFIILPISQMIGVKYSIHLLGIPMIICTLLTIFATNAYFLYVARVLGGMVGGALAIAIPVLITDISFDNVRGSLISFYDPIFNLGTFASFLLGNYLSCTAQVKIQLIPQLIFLVALFFLPESPEFLRARNKKELANESLRFYKGIEAPHDKPINSDPIALIESVDKNEEKLKNSTDDHDENDLNSPLTFKDFCTPHAKKSLAIAVVMEFLAYISGTLTMISFITWIFNETGSYLSEKDSSILVSITQLTANGLFISIVDRFNRRVCSDNLKFVETLYVWSSLFATLAYFLLGLYGYLWLKQPGFEWMPPLTMGFIIFTSCLGMVSMPYVIAVEIFPKKIQQIGLSVIVAMFWVISFVLSSVFFILVETFGLFNCMFGSGVICLLNALFGIFFMIETRGKSFAEIREIMANYSGPKWR